MKKKIKDIMKQMSKKIFVIIIVLIIIGLFIAAATGNIKALLALWKRV